MLTAVPRTPLQSLDLSHRRQKPTLDQPFPTLHVQQGELAQLPVPSATPEQQAPIVALVEQVLAANAANSAADTTALEAEIDARVAALYGLTAAEVAQL